MKNGNFSLILFVCVCFCVETISAQGQSCTVENSIRLNRVGIYSTSSRFGRSGRLEICYCTNGSCTWSSISIGSSTSPWSWKNVQVACGQLSLGGIGNPIINTPSDTIDTSLNIYPLTFQCDGTETNLTNCTTASLMTHIHEFDVFITCSNVRNNDIRLIGTTTRDSGAVEILQESKWGIVCVDSFGSNEANIACRSLGYDSGSITTFQTNQFQGSEVNTTSKTNIQCNGNEINIESCTITRSTSCGTNVVIAGVICTSSAMSEGSVRLIALPGNTEQLRIELLYAGRWGTICSSSWNINDGDVICRSFNRGTATSSVSSPFSALANSKRPIWASGYRCSGTETQLNSCSLTYPIGYAPGCSHSDDVGTFCTNVGVGSSGLSAGATIGIVFGVAAVMFFVIPSIFAYTRHAWKSGQMRGWWTRNRSSAAVLNRAPADITQTTTIHSTAIDQPVVTPNDARTVQPVDGELTNAPPPSYGDALLLETLKSPPKYETSIASTELPPPYY